MTNKPILSYSDFAREFIIYTDASGYGIGAALAQMQSLPSPAEDNEINNTRIPATHEEKEVVIAYTSKHFNDREAKWSTTEKECYAIIHAIVVFRTYL